MKHEFRVPLHADEEGVAALAFNRLYDPRLVSADNAQIIPEPIDRLVMKRIHVAGIAVKDASEPLVTLEVEDSSRC